MEHLLYKEARQQRTTRFAKRPNHQHLLTGLAHLQAAQGQTPGPTEKAPADLRDAESTKLCPICHVPATPKHILWLRKWHRDQNHKPLPPEWMERITCQEEEPLWSKGWIPLEPQEHLHPYQGHGIWQDLQPIRPDQYVGWAFALDATPSHYDSRSQVWVFGLCVHTQSMGQLKRLGAITGVPQGQQTKGRALFAGLVALAKHDQPGQGDCPTQLSLGGLEQTTTTASLPRPPRWHHRPRQETHHSALHQPQHQDT